MKVSFHIVEEVRLLPLVEADRGIRRQGQVQALLPDEKPAQTEERLRMKVGVIGHSSFGFTCLPGPPGTRVRKDQARRAARIAAYSSAASDGLDTERPVNSVSFESL